MENLSQKSELRDRVEAKRKELEATLQSAKADGKSEAREQASKVEAKLGELNDTLSQGWDRVSEETAKKLNQWLNE